MDCINGLINDTLGVRVIETNKPFQEWINPNTLLANKHGVACKTGFDLGMQVDTLKAPWPEVSNWRRTEDMVDPCGSNCNPSFSFGVQMDSLEAHVPEDIHGKNTEERMWETISIDQAFTYLEMTATQPSLDNLICVLQKCREKKDLACAKRAYFHACHNGLEAHTVLGNYLVPMFVDCGCLSEGRQVFARLAKRNEHSWTSLIQGCIEWGESQHAFDLFERMDYDSIQPSRFTFVALLKACARVKGMERGRELHAEITKQGCETDSFVGNILVDVYAKCGSLAEAQQVFNKLPVQDEVSWNTLIAGYAEHGHGEEALKRLEQMQLDGMSPNAVTFICGLRASGTTGALEKGQGIHAELAREGYESAFNVGSTLVDMYAKCGSLVEARDAFDNLRGRDAISWNPLIIGYAEQGFGKEALDCLEEMKLEGVSPDAVSLAGCIKACGSIGALNKGQEIHAESAKQGFERDPFIGSSLVDMYAKFGSVVEAQEVFNKLSFRGVVPWTALIAGYADHGLGEEALNCLGQMHLEGVPPNDITLVCSLKACGSIGAVEKGRELHIEIAKEGFEKDPFIGSALVDMYAKCGSLAEAQESLVRLPVRGVVAWTALIAGYAEEGLGEEAFYSLKQMQVDGVFPNAVTFACSLKACGSLAAIHRGQELYASIVVEGFEQQPFVGSLLVDMYVKCGSLAEAREVFDKLPSRDVAAWNALIAGYAEHGFCEEALNSFEQMQLEGMSPNAITFVWALKACGMLQAIGRGQEFVIQIAKKGLDKDSFICNTLVDLYAKCGFLIDAQDAFDKLPVQDVVSWTSLIAGYAEYGFGKEALNCSIQMKSEGLLPDAGTFVCCLKACGSVGAIDRGREIHTEICIEGFETDFLVGNTLVDMYANCGLLLEAREVFDELQIQDVVSWTALIGGYAEHGHEKEALNCFQHMQLKGVSPDVVSWNNVILGYAQQGWSEKAFELYAQMQEQCLLPNKVTLTNNLKACGTTAALKIGKKIVTQIYAGSRVELTEVVLENAVVDMYGRCGSMVDAQQAFDAMPTRQLVTWNGLITGYARQGESEVIFHLLARMKEEGIWPNEITLLCVLIACNHAGLIDRGKKYFEAMSTEYRLDRSIMHYNCMIDLLGRAGRLDEIVILLQEMPFQPNHVTWTTVLSACQKWGNIELGRHAFESLVRLDGRNISAFVLMSNIYANAHMWDEVKKIESMRVYLGVSQESGKSWIEVGEAVHAIVSGDTKPCKRKESNVKRKHISIGLEGFCLPNFSRFLQDTDDDAKGEALCVYTQKRTNAQGLISAPEYAPIRIVKNLWVCDDCHVAMALLSKAEKRTIACRDAGRTHVFKDGKCSCMNYS